MKIFGFAGWSGSGKTTLIEQLIPRFVAHGLRVSLIKHAHHEFDADIPGKDSYRHRHAGCQEVLITSRVRWALMHELRGEDELSLDECVRHMAPCDLLLVEGHKRHPMPKLEIWRAGNGKPLLHPDDPHIVAVATDGEWDAPGSGPATALPRYHLNDIGPIADFILEHNGLK
ncbi:MAG: molybdopterin-guanine dinucleotide biosynthesis protein B [Betaproteobacteria bacterium]|nr:molybdopterin-guanine dinucleotide biosynthesis protein B [Betaproteobacteria bacterium]